MIAQIVIAIILGITLQSAFIVAEHKEKYVAADILKGLASAMFVFIGIKAHLFYEAKYSLLILIGLVCGMIGDILLNLRFVFQKNGQKIFLAGIFVFLIGHVIYLIALLPKAQHTLACVMIGALIAAGLLAYIFKTMNVKIAFKIFGIFYLGAVIIMTSIAIGIAIFKPDAAAIVYAIGAVLFTASDIVLIFNTFSGVTKFSLRITNLSLYYIGQILIAFSVLLIPVYQIA